MAPHMGSAPRSGMLRRSLLRLPAAGASAVAVSVALGGCGDDGRVGTTGNRIETVRYGDDRSQFAELSRPSGTPRGVVVVIHGGFWKAAYDLSLGRPLA